MAPCCPSLTHPAPCPAFPQQLLPHASNKDRGIGLLNALKVMDRLKAAQAALGRGVASASGSRNTPSDLKRQLDEQLGVVTKLGRWVVQEWLPLMRAAVMVVVTKLGK